MDDTTSINIDESLIKKAEASSIALAQGRQPRRSDKLKDFLNIGRVSHEIAIQVKSTKIHGQHLAKLLPETQKLDDTLRSNCKWLYEALHVPSSDGANILGVLGVETLSEFKSANPTVIRREYNIAKGGWDYANPKRKRAMEDISDSEPSSESPMLEKPLPTDDSEPEPGAASPMPNKPLPRNVPSNGAASEALL